MTDAHDDTGVRCTMLRGGTSRGLFFLADDLPTDPAERDDLLLRLMGTPDPQQLDGLGGGTSVTSKVAVVSPSADPGADVDYLFLQLGVDRATVSDRQNCGNILAGVGPFAVARGLVAPGGEETTVRIRMVNTESPATATFATGTGTVLGPATVVLTFGGADGADAAALLPTGRVRDTVGGVEVTCVDNGMPVVLARADSFGLTGAEPVDQLAADAPLLARIDGLRQQAATLMGLGDVRDSSVPKTVLVSTPRDGGHVATRSFIPVQPHPAVGVLAAVTAVTGLRMPGAVGHELTADWPADQSQVDVEHPSGHLVVDVVVDPATDPPRAVRSGVVRTARTLFDGIAYPRPR